MVLPLCTASASKYASPLLDTSTILMRAERQYSPTAVLYALFGVVAKRDRPAVNHNDGRNVTLVCLR